MNKIPIVSLDVDKSQRYQEKAYDYVHYRDAAIAYDSKCRSTKDFIQNGAGENGYEQEA